MKRTLQDLCGEIDKESQLESLKNCPDNEYTVKLSKFMSLSNRTDTLIALLDEYFEIEQEGTNYTLILKK